MFLPSPQHRLTKSRVRPRLNLEAPGPTILPTELIRDLRNTSRVDEGVVGLLGHRLSRLREVDNTVDNDQGDVDAFRPQLARHQLGEAALRRLGRRERCRLDPAAT